MRIQDLSPIKLAKRVYNASQKSWAITNTFEYERRASEAGQSVTAKGHILTRTTAQKDNSALAAFLKNPTLTLMVANILAQGTEALKKWSDTMQRIANSHSNSAISSSSSITSRAIDKIVEKIEGPQIQANGYFSRSHFDLASKNIAREAVHFIENQNSQASRIAQYILNDPYLDHNKNVSLETKHNAKSDLPVFQGPFLPSVQNQVSALQNGELDITSFATSYLKENSGIYRLGDMDYALTSELAQRLQNQFGSSSDTLKVDVITAFKGTTPEPDRIFNEPAIDCAIAPKHSGPRQSGFRI